MRLREYLMPSSDEQGCHSSCNYTLEAPFDYGKTREIKRSLAKTAESLCWLERCCGEAGCFVI